MLVPDRDRILFTEIVLALVNVQVEGLADLLRFADPLAANWNAHVDTVAPRMRLGVTDPVVAKVQVAGAIALWRFAIALVSTVEKAHVDGERGRCLITLAV